MAIKVGMVSLGCSKNLVDSERMLYKLRSHGYKLRIHQVRKRGGYRDYS